jgi:large subunit ribosomal protein L29
MKASEMRDQSVDELKALVIEKQKGLFQLKNQRQKEKKMDKPHLLREHRKDVARLLTVLSEKERKV